MRARVAVRTTDDDGEDANDDANDDDDCDYDVRIAFCWMIIIVVVVVVVIIIEVVVVVALEWIVVALDLCVALLAWVYFVFWFGCLPLGVCTFIACYAVLCYAMLCCAMDCQWTTFPHRQAGRYDRLSITRCPLRFCRPIQPAGARCNRVRFFLTAVVVDCCGC